MGTTSLSTAKALDSTIPSGIDAAATAAVSPSATTVTAAAVAAPAIEARVTDQAKRENPLPDQRSLKSSTDPLTRLTSLARSKYEQAAALFPSFCHDWERKLHDRELNNLRNIHWQVRDGYETASYVGYGKVKRCETKESAQGVPIGKLTYEEFNFNLIGKTLDEALHTKPKLLGITTTLEIFSWEKNGWFY